MILILSDVDGTIIDHATYEPGPALEAARRLSERGAAIVLVSSKTSAELRVWLERFGLTEPIIPENGGAIEVPVGYRGWSLPWPQKDGFWVKRLSPPLEEFYRVVRELNSKWGFKLRPITEVPAEEISRHTGLPLWMAELAQKREYSMPVVVEEGEPQALARALRELGFKLVLGRRFHHIAASDKGRAAKELIALYKKFYSDVKVVAVGDNVNDEPMLRVADYPVLVQREPGVWDERVKVPNLIKAPAPGPEGWAWMAENVIKES